MADKIFIDGMVVKEPRQYEDFKVSIKWEDFRQFCNTHVNQNGWLTIVGKTSKSGKRYAELDTWQPSQSRQGEGSYPAAAQRQYAPRQTPPPPPYPRQAAPPPPAPRQPELEAESIDDIPFDPPKEDDYDKIMRRLAPPPLITHVTPSADAVYPNRARGSNYCGD